MFRRSLISNSKRTLNAFTAKRLVSSSTINHGQSSQVTSAQDKPISQDILYKDDHVQLKESLRKLIDKEINPYVDQWEEEGIYPAHQVFKKLGDAGLLGVNKPTDYGGLGLDFSYSVAVAEELGNIRCGGIPMSIGVQTDMATPALARFGSDKLKREFLAPSIAGDFVACLGVSEVGSGSDVASIQTKAETKGDDLIINGGKMWTTNGTQADWMCLLANTNSGPPHKSKSLICLPMNLPGIQVSERIDKLGMRSSDTAQVFFEDVRVPRSHIIGEEGQGFTYQMLQFQEERLWGIAATLLPLEKVIELTIDYTRQRRAFGQPILNNQVVHFTLAELSTEIEHLKAMLYRAVLLYIQGNDVTRLASMGKLKAGRLARETMDKCLQFWGGMGFVSETLVSRYYRNPTQHVGEVTVVLHSGQRVSSKLFLFYFVHETTPTYGVHPLFTSVINCHRDFRLLSIGAGADEVMLSIICKYMDTLPRPPKTKK